MLVSLASAVALAVIVNFTASASPVRALVAPMNFALLILASATAVWLLGLHVLAETRVTSETATPPRYRFWPFLLGPICLLTYTLFFVISPHVDQESSFLYSTLRLAAAISMPVLFAASVAAPWIAAQSLARADRHPLHASTNDVVWRFLVLLVPLIGAWVLRNEIVRLGATR